VLINDTVIYNLFTLIKRKKHKTRRERRKQKQKNHQRPTKMWALRRLEIRLLQCALCFYLSAQVCDSVHQRRELSTKNTGKTIAWRLKLCAVLLTSSSRNVSSWFCKFIRCGDERTGRWKILGVLTRERFFRHEQGI
jgi:hypothetical protein